MRRFLISLVIMLFYCFMPFYNVMAQSDSVNASSDRSTTIESNATGETNPKVKLKPQEQVIKNENELREQKKSLEATLGSNDSIANKVQAVENYHKFIKKIANEPYHKKPTPADSAFSLAWILEDEALKMLDVGMIELEDNWCESKKNSLMTGFNPSAEKIEELPSNIVWLYERVEELCKSAKK